MYHNIVYLKSTNLIFFFHICYVWNWSLLIFIGGLALIVIIIYYNGSNNSDKNKNNGSYNSNKITTTTIMTITKFLHHNPHIGIEWSTVYYYYFFERKRDVTLLLTRKWRVVCSLLRPPCENSMPRWRILFTTSCLWFDRTWRVICFMIRYMARWPCFHCKAPCHP